MKYLYAFLFTLTLLLANSNPQYQSALKLFQSAQYQKAFDAFEALVEEDPASLEYNFYYARSAFILKKVNLAIAA